MSFNIKKKDIIKYSIFIIVSLVSAYIITHNII